MSAVHHDLSVTCSGCQRTFDDIATWKAHRHGGRCRTGSRMKRLIGWGMFLAPPVAFGAVSYTTGELAVVLGIGLLTGAASVGAMAIMDRGLRMIHDGRHT